jgi:hypothetical protein
MKFSISNKMILINYHLLPEKFILMLILLDDGYTMAHLAASRGQGESFSCLIVHDAQLDVYTFDRHESVLDIAKRSGKNRRIEQARKYK